jgi:TM2 domain-containing membrane protein YozV
MYQKCIISLFLFLSSNVVSGQYSQEKVFINYLTKEGLLNEKYYLLMSLKDSTNTIVKAEKAWTLSKLGSKRLALKYYQDISFDSVLANGFAGNYMKSFLLSDSLTKIRKLLKDSGNILDSSLRNKMELSVSLLNGTVPSDVLLPDYLSNAYLKHLVYKKKTLAIATGLSVLVPGMGKIYMKKPRQGLNMFLANLIFGIQAFESFKKAGPESIRFIAFGSLFSAFYTGNIYGTYKGFKKVRRDTYQQLKYEMEEYYLADLDTYPY